MTLTIMSHHLDALSPLLSSSHMCSKPRLQSSSSSASCSVVRNLQVLFEEQSSLPMIKRSDHPDLQRITASTLVSLLENQSDDLLIIDARYPFEYAGGHIISAQNIYTEDDLRLLFSKLLFSSTRPSILIFHCEFSSSRGPRLCRLFRSLDRQYNLSNYPQLLFPSIYLLDGGYAEFYHQPSSKAFCEPQAYISMFEQQYTQELQIYRQAKKVANGRIMTKKLIEQQGPIQFCMS